MPVSIGFHGAARTVTGSCLLVAAGDTRVLIDCGMFQGSKALKQLNYGPFPFEPSAIDAVLLTHAHIDHSGLVPKLMRDGFTGPVFATHGTRDLSSALLPDAGHIQEFEVEILNRRNRRRGVPEVVPIFTRADGVSAIQAFRAVEYGEWCRPANGLRARFWNAGHILGSASIELEIAGSGDGKAPLRLLVSGDLGPQRKLLERPTTAPQGIDYLFCEATYGNTDRPDVTAAERRAFLASVVRDAVNPEAPLLVPAFAVERTQELLVDLVTLMGSGAVPAAPIFVDSPLATRTTEIFLRHASELGDGATAADALRSPLLRFTETEEESDAIARTPGFKIVLAGSGMCDAGRIRGHLKRWLWQRAATVLLAGYQAPGTLGRILQEGADAVRIQGDEVSVRARIRWTDDYSGHADCGELLDWIAARQPIGRGLFVTHGEESAIAALAARLRAAHLPGVPLQPLLDDVYDLTPAGPRLHSPQPPKRLAPEAISRTDWHNERSRLLLEISASLQSAPDDAARLSLIERLRHAMESTAS